MLKKKPTSYDQILLYVNFFGGNQPLGIVALGAFASLTICKAGLSGASV